MGAFQAESERGRVSGAAVACAHGAKRPPGVVRGFVRRWKGQSGGAS
jgi:hypothetical protein